MRPVDINLASRPFRNNALYWAGFGSAALVLLVLTVVNLWLFVGYGSAMERQQQDLVGKQSRRDRLLREEQRLGQKLSKLDFKGLAGQAEFANDAIRRRTFSWTQLFNRLEEVVPPTVMMASIRPEIQAEGISLVVEGYAKDQDGLLTYEENLIRSRFFTRIYPGSERREQRDRQLRFSLKLDYLPAGWPGVEPAPEASPPAKPEPPKPPATAESAPSPSPGAGPPSEPEKTGAAPTPASIIGNVAVSSSSSAKSTEAQSPPGATTGGPSPSAAASTTNPHLPPAPPPSPPAIPQVAHRPRPLLRPGQRIGRPGSLTPGGGTGSPASSTDPDAVAGRGQFVNVPMQDVLDYLMKERKMTFIFGGDFDLRKKVSMNLAGKDEDDVLLAISQALDCFIARPSPGVYRLSPRADGEPLAEPPVEEEPMVDTETETPDEESP